MRIEWWILILVHLVAFAILLTIPKEKIRLALVAFLFKQVITFLLGLVVVELGLLEYPIRFFASVNRTSITYEYLAFPATCALFNVWYPLARSTSVKLGFYIGFSSVLTFVEVILEKYTDLISYIHWEWYTTWISICLSFFLVRWFCVWFFERS